MKRTGARAYQSHQGVGPYVPAKPVGGHTGRVAAELHKLTGKSVAHCQLILAGGTMRLAGLIVQAHVNAGDLGPTFIQRIEPIECALGRVPLEHYCLRLEELEQASDGDENLAQTRYLAEPTLEHARQRIKADRKQIAALQGLDRALARRHGLSL